MQPTVSAQKPILAGAVPFPLTGISPPTKSVRDVVMRGNRTNVAPHHRRLSALIALRDVPVAPSTLAARHTPSGGDARRQFHKRRSILRESVESLPQSHRNLG